MRENAGSTPAVRPKPIRVLVVDDHTLVAVALREVLDDRDDVDAVAVAHSAHEAIRLAEVLRPDVVLLDYRLGDRDGIETGIAIRAALPGTALILLSGAPTSRMIGDAIEAGFSGYLDKTCSIERLVAAVRTVAAGELALDAAAVGNLIRTPAGPTLTSRETQVLDLMAEGLATKEIAAKMFVSVNTARKHIQSVLVALGAHSKLEAVVNARRVGLID